MPQSSDVRDPVLPEPQQAHIAPDLVSAILASSEDAIISQDLQGRITSWNKGAEQLLGYTAGEMIGRSILQLSHPGLHHREARTNQIIRRGERVANHDTSRETKDGRRIDVSISASPIKDADGRIVGVLKIERDITVLKQREREIVRLSRLYAALSRISSAIIYVPTKDELFDKVCQALVEQGGFRAVWIGWQDQRTHQLLPVASYGDTANYIGSITIYTDDRPEGRGPTGIAFREGRNYICNDITRDPATLPWRAKMSAHGWMASAVFPIRSDDKTCATITVYSEESGFFQDKEVSLLTEVADVVSFALNNFAREDVRRKAEKAVRDERDFIAALMNSVPGVLYLYDHTGRFLRWNRSFERVTGYTEDEIKTMHPTDFFARTDQDLVCDKIADVFEQGASNVEADFRSKDGRLTPYYFTGVQAEVEGQKCLVGVGIDITERKRAELARRAAEVATREAQSELARVARVSLLGEFAASVAHEINQPLAAIVTNSGASMRWLAKDPPNLDEAKYAINRITRDANRASDVIKRLRALVTRKAPEYADVDLNNALDEALVFIHSDLRSANVLVDTELADGLPPVRGDRIQLQQVMLNLITNGIDAMKSVGDRPRVLHIKTRMAESGDVLLEVEDSGVGIDPATADHLFTHFFSTKAGGTGLGLAISKTIIEGHGGRLKANAASQHGAIFQFTVPRATAPSP